MLQIAVAVMAVAMAVVHGFMRSVLERRERIMTCPGRSVLLLLKKYRSTRVYVSRDVYLKE